MNDTIHTKITALKNQVDFKDKLLIDSVLNIVSENIEACDKRMRELLLRGEKFGNAMAQWMEDHVQSEIVPWVNKWSFQRQFESFRDKWWKDFGNE
jgi:hypothetical protein